MQKRLQNANDDTLVETEIYIYPVSKAGTEGAFKPRNLTGSLFPLSNTLN